MTSHISDERAHYYFQVENDVFDSGAAMVIKPTAFVVYCYLIRRTNTDKEYAWPGIPDISRQCGMSSPTVIGAIAELEKYGLLIVDRITGKSNHYRVQSPDQSKFFTGQPVKNLEGVPVKNLNGTRKESLPKEELVSKSIEEEKTKRAREDKRATGTPDQYRPTVAQLQWARDELTMEVTTVERETEQFLDFHRAKGTTFKDWDAAWRTWMRNSVKFDRPKNGPAAKKESTSDKNRRNWEEAFGTQQPANVMETKWRVSE